MSDSLPTIIEQPSLTQLRSAVHGSSWYGDMLEDTLNQQRIDYEAESYRQTGENNDQPNH